MYLAGLQTLQNDTRSIQYQSNTHCFPTAIMVARTRFNITFYVHCLYCYSFSTDDDTLEWKNPAFYTGEYNFYNKKYLCSKNVLFNNIVCWETNHCSLAESHKHFSIKFCCRNCGTRRRKQVVSPKHRYLYARLKYVTCLKIVVLDFTSLRN